MIVHNKPTYQCEYCKKMYIIKSACERHEIGCKKNPKNFRACFGCEHMKSRIEHVSFDNPGYGESTEERILLFCSAKKSYFYPPKIERGKNWHEMENIGNGKIPNEPMPRKCTEKPEELLFDEEFKDYFL